MSGLWDDPNKPVSDPAFWRKRLLWAAATGRGTHTAIYDIDRTVWNRIQAATRTVLASKLREGDSLLDAGCGYGAMADCLPPGVNYMGVDCSDDLIDVARMAHPEERFLTTDPRELPFLDGSFRWSVCRSVRKMVVDNVGEAQWRQMERELLRVSKQILVLEYEDVCRRVEVLG